MGDFCLAFVANHHGGLAFSNDSDVAIFCHRGNSFTEGVVFCGEGDVAGGVVAVMGNDS